MGYHGIEKGLALPNPRPGFGRKQIDILISRLRRYQRAFGLDENAVIALNVLRKYSEFNKLHGKPDQELELQIEELACFASERACGTSSGGVKVVKREDFLKAAKMNLTDFFNSRASVRQYADVPVALAEIEQAINLARSTPSCCNRQSWRVWILDRRDDIQKALDIQGGARGFKHEIPMVIVVTSDLACFQSSGERYQSWIDGGMFAMSLIYALHSQGLVSCCLNWSKDHMTDKQFKREFKIPPNETIIMLISVGHPKDEYVVAQSARHSPKQFMKVV